MWDVPTFIDLGLNLYKTNTFKVVGNILVDRTFFKVSQSIIDLFLWNLLLSPTKFKWFTVQLNQSRKLHYNNILIVILCDNFMFVTT